VIPQTPSSTSLPPRTTLATSPLTPEPPRSGRRRLSGEPPPPQFLPRPLDIDPSARFDNLSEPLRINLDRSILIKSNGTYSGSGWNGIDQWGRTACQPTDSPRSNFVLNFSEYALNL
jgi:hypothetical protein